jgi:hypothetical protein
MTFGDGTQLLANGSALNVTGGVVEVGASVQWRDLSLNYLDGEVRGAAPMLRSSRIQIGAEAAPMLFRIGGGENVVTHNLPAGQTLWVQGNSILGASTLTANGGFENAGTLRFESVDSSWDTAMVVNQGLMRNRPSGVMIFGQGAAGRRVLNADILNEGRISVEHDLEAIKQGGVIENRGAFEVSNNTRLLLGSSIAGNEGTLIQAAGTLGLGNGVTVMGNGDRINVTGGTVQIGSGVQLRDVEINYSGGQTAGAVPLLRNTVLKIGGGAGASTWVIAGMENELGANLPAGHTLVVQGNSITGAAELKVGNEVINRGIIRLESVDSSWDAAVSAVGTLRNGIGGLVVVNAGAAGKRTINAPLWNEGTVRANYDLTLGGAEMSHTNAGTLEINPGATVTVAGKLTQSGGEIVLNDGVLRGSNPVVLNGGMLRGLGSVQSDVENSGTINPADGVLQISGRLDQTVNGVLSARLSSLPGVVVNRLTVAGMASLNGTLRVEGPGNHTYSLGNKYRVLTAESVTGTFSNLALPALANQMEWRVTYGATSVDVEVVRAANAVGLDNPSVNSEGKFRFAFSAPTGGTYIIQASTDLVNWETLTTVDQASSPTEVVDPASGSQHYRFYRAIKQ